MKYFYNILVLTTLVVVVGILDSVLDYQILLRISSSNTLFNNNNNNEQQYHRELVQLRGGGSIKPKSMGRISSISSSKSWMDRNNARKTEYRLMNRNLQWSVLDLKMRENNLQQQQSQRRPYVFYTIFAGRHAPLSVQMEYVSVLLKENHIDEVHLWDYTCYKWNFHGERDALYLRDVLWRMDDRIYIIKSKNCGWSEYYNFYHRKLQPDDVLIKADDDVVYLDTKRFEGFVQTIRHYSDEVYMWTSNTINNGMIAALHVQDGLLSNSNINNNDDSNNSTNLLSSISMEIEPFCPQRLDECLSMNGTKGKMLHEAFLSDPKRFRTPTPGKELRRIKGRMSINFIAWSGKSYDRTMIHLRTNIKGDTVGGSDEVALTTGATAAPLHEKLIVYMPFVVAHASFGSQHLQNNDYVFDLYRNAMPLLLNNTKEEEWIKPAEFVFPLVLNA